ncbi:MAG: response regulator transcription factor [Treponema sp.]|nr:response regulator transcription factor [Treponema sp.]
MQKTFYIVDDHEMMRLGTATYITAHSDWSCIGNSADGVTTLADLNLLDSTGKLPAVVICDLNFDGDDSGFDLVKRIHELYPRLWIIGYSMYLAPGIVQNTIRSGASGYVSKSAPSEDLLRCMEHVFAGKIFVQDELQEKLEQYNNFVDALTRREKEVLELILRQMSNDQIAEALDLRQRVVANYVSSIYEKTGINDRAELVKRFGP